MGPASAIPQSKSQHKGYWDQCKSDPSKSSNFCTFTFPIAIQGQGQNLKTLGTEPFSPMKPKSSILKANLKKTMTFQGDSQSTKNDEELSKQFQSLKEQEERLVSQRERMFKQVPSGSTKSKQKTSQIIIRMPFLQYSCIVIFGFSGDRKLFKIKSVCLRGALRNDDIDKLNNNFLETAIIKQIQDQ